MSPVLEWSLYLAYVVLAVAFILAIVRMVKGPTLPDRVVALDLISYLAVGFIALTTLYSQQSIYVDVALALALIAFLAVIAFARYIEQGHEELVQQEEGQ